ncbi:MAG: endonuclease/exonuclease/phosphatase family protein [Candidatus Eisenbacteria bacterium]
MSARPLIPLLLLAALLAAVLLAIRGAIGAYRPAAMTEVALGGEDAAAPPAGDSLRILSWNIGFASMSAEADFFADGGRGLRAPSRAMVERNVAAIGELLRFEAPDIVLAQELAGASWLTHGVDVLGDLRTRLKEYRLAFAPTVEVAPLPAIGGLTVGSGTLGRVAVAGATRHQLPSKPLPLGVTLQHFNALETRLPISGRAKEWVIFEVHLAAFDDGSLRRKQLERVLWLMEREFAAGNHVIAGGDWNLRLAATDFPYTTAEKAKFWVRDFPADLTPAGWRWAVDATVPTCRTLERPYRPGVNYTCVIDGFLVSPNVEVASVETIDLAFTHSDHNPVRLAVRAK